MNERVIAARRLPKIGQLLLLALYVLAAFALTRAEDLLLSLFGWILGALVGLFAIQILVGALFPRNLILSAEGFQASGLRRRPLVRWSGVERFWVLRTPLFAYVLYALAGQPRRENFGLWVFRGLPSEADGRLLPVYELKADALLEVLNDWKGDTGREGVQASEPARLAPAFPGMSG